MSGLPRPVWEPLGRANAAMAREDRSDCARARHPLMALGQKPRTELTSSPGRTRLTSCQYRPLNFRRGAKRRVVGPPRKVHQAVVVPFTKTPEPLVTRRGADPEVATQSPHVRPLSLRQRHELSSLGHLRHLFPGHDHLSMDKVMPIMVFTMSPNMCPLCPRSAHRGSGGCAPVQELNGRVSGISILR